MKESFKRNRQARGKTYTRFTHTKKQVDMCTCCPRTQNVRTQRNKCTGAAYTNTHTVCVREDGALKVRKAKVHALNVNACL